MSSRPGIRGSSLEPACNFFWLDCFLPAIAPPTPPSVAPIAAPAGPPMPCPAKPPMAAPKVPDANAPACKSVSPSTSSRPGILGSS